MTDTLENNKESDALSREEYDSRARMERLGKRPGVRSQSHGYTRFVKVMRFALPAVAILMMFVVYIRSDMDETVIAPIDQSTMEIKPEELARNELTNPAFESRDKNGRPYTITAERAVQEESNKSIVLLSFPEGQIETDKGMKVTVRAREGVYDQDKEAFFLRGDVTLLHSDGYLVTGEEAHIDLRTQYVRSDRPVRGEGEEILLVAQGLRADGEAGVFLFTGPASLTLKQGFEGLER